MATESQHPDLPRTAEPLRWQSRLLCLVVIPVCATWLVLFTNQFWTPATMKGLAICAGFSLLVWLLKAATAAASATGFVLTACMYLATANQARASWLETAFPAGLTLFVLAFLATRFRRDSKERMGTGEGRSGRRAAQIVANLGVSAFAGVCLMSQPVAGLAALVAALAEATADTVSSELGQVLGGTPRLITSLRTVPAGTDGGISLLGTVAGIIASSLVVAVSIPTMHLSNRIAWIAWAGGIVGLFFDSLLGATMERRGWLNNDAVNFLSTLAAATVAASLAPEF
jgi:uncharacterized protein (TIGR00297 family)